MTGVDHPFAIVPLRLVGDTTITDSAIRVYAVLAEMANKDRMSWPSHATIAERCGKSVATVRRCIDQLEEAGWLARTGRLDEEGRRTSNVYTVMRLQGGVLTSEQGEVLTSEQVPCSPVSDKPDPDEPDPDEPYVQQLPTLIHETQWQPTPRHLATARQMELSDDEIDTIAIAVAALDIPHRKRGEQFVKQCMYQAQFNKRNPRKEQDADWLEQWANQ